MAILSFEEQVNWLSLFFSLDKETNELALLQMDGFVSNWNDSLNEIIYIAYLSFAKAEYRNNENRYKYAHYITSLFKDKTDLHIISENLVNGKIIPIEILNLDSNKLFKLIVSQREYSIVRDIISHSIGGEKEKAILYYEMFLATKNPKWLESDVHCVIIISNGKMQLNDFPLERVGRFLNNKMLYYGEYNFEQYLETLTSEQISFLINRANQNDFFVKAAFETLTKKGQVIQVDYTLGGQDYIYSAYVFIKKATDTYTELCFYIATLFETFIFHNEIPALDILWFKKFFKHKRPKVQKVICNAQAPLPQLNIYC
jgi:hypothetical protein